MGDTAINNVQGEVLFIGALYKNPDLYLEYERFIKSKYYFTDPVTEFLYNAGYQIYKNRTQEFSESAIEFFMEENEERYSKYRLYGGYDTIETWMEGTNVEDHKNYFQVLQKYALLREYDRKGINVESYISSPKFASYSAKEVYYRIKKRVDDIHTRISGDPDVEELNKGVKKMVNDFLETPSMGVITPFPSFNELFRGLRKGTAMAVGMTSNSGKTRFMIKLLAYLALVQEVKCIVMLNEMSVEDIRLALLTTCINNPEFQEIHGVKITKIEKQLALGIYFDDNGEEINRGEKDEEGNWIEPIDSFIERLNRTSKQYRDVCKVADWIEEKFESMIYVIDVSTSYRDDDLENYIRKGYETKGIKYFFYDTLKNESSTIGEWAALKETATKLAELAKQLDVFVYGSIQLTDDVNNIDPLELNSMNIAASKGLKTVLSTLTLWKEIDPETYDKYCYMPTDPTKKDEWGKGKGNMWSLERKQENIRYYSCITDKNRAGAKKKLVFELNLDTNVWTELGEIFRGDKTLNASEIKKQIYYKKLIVKLLEDLGCGHIRYHSSGYYTCSNPDGDNHTAITIYNDDYLRVINYTREMHEPSDIITLVEFIRNETFFKSIKYICELLELDIYDDPKKDIPESLRLTEKLRRIRLGGARDLEDDEPIKPLSEAVLGYYRPYVNDMFLSDGISYSTQKEFEIGYDEYTNRITIPIRDEYGTLVGIKGRLFKEELEDDELKYYYIEPCPRNKVLYGYHKTGSFIKNLGEIFVTESEKGVLQLWSYGYKNSIGTGGTKIGKSQIDHITRLGAKIIFAFDKDVDAEHLEIIANQFIDKIKIYAIIDKDNILEEKESPSDNKKKWEYLVKNNIYQIR